MDRNKYITRALLSTALVMLMSLLLISPSYAASQCKGLDNQACEQNASCGWIESYKRKDGRQVMAFCRNKGKAKKKVKSAPVAVEKAKQ